MNHLIQFSSFLKLSGLFHTFSTRQSGNLNPLKERNNYLVTLNNNHQRFFSNLNISSKNLVFMEQVHGNQVVSCDQDCAGHWIPGVDGLVTKKKNLFLCANTADCVPLFFFEPENKIIGIAHAGWKGTLGQIGKKVISHIIKKHGGDIKNILVGIGPAICGKCYEVNKERYELFEKKGLIYHHNDIIESFFLDLKAINAKILIEAGIKPKNIEISPYCTVCNNDLFFSYRKNKEKNYREMLGIIGLKE